MKIIVVLLAALFILLTRYSPPKEVCNLFTAEQSIPPRIFAESTIDGQRQNPLITRYFHNKVEIVLSEFSRCYFNFFDPLFFFQATSIFGMVALLYLIYKTSVQKRLYILIPLIILPALPFFYFPIAAIVFIYKLFAIIGVVFWLYFR